jgi:hypothetical protein
VWLLMDLSRNRRAGGPGNPSRRKGHVHRSRRSVPPRQQGATSTSDTLPKRMGTVHPCRPVKYAQVACGRDRYILEALGRSLHCRRNSDISAPYGPYGPTTLTSWRQWLYPRRAVIGPSTVVDHLPPETPAGARQGWEGLLLPRSASRTCR